MVATRHFAACFLVMLATGGILLATTEFLPRLVQQEFGYTGLQAAMTAKGSTMKIERHETGPRMSKAVIHGDTVYLAGIVADNSKGKSTAEQTRSILSQINTFLATAGTNKNKLLSA